MQISIELVPRSLDYLSEEVDLIQHHFPAVNTINIPDLTRCKLRSWEGCAAVSATHKAIPHIRARDFWRNEPETILQTVDALTHPSLLVVGGDLFGDESRAEERHDSLSLMRFLSETRPSINVYGAIDPYRQSFANEVAYAQQKKEAGAIGFFTQPFFDLRLMEIYADLLPDGDFFWGVAPVLTENSKRYWIKRNHAFFPPDFDCTLQWNRDFARDALAFARQRNHHIYFMPILADVVSYLDGIL